MRVYKSVEAVSHSLARPLLLFSPLHFPSLFVHGRLQVSGTSQYAYCIELTLLQFFVAFLYRWVAQPTPRCCLLDQKLLLCPNGYVMRSPFHLRPIPSIVVRLLEVVTDPSSANKVFVVVSETLPKLRTRSLQFRGQVCISTCLTCLYSTFTSTTISHCFDGPRIPPTIPSILSFSSGRICYHSPNGRSRNTLSRKCSQRTCHYSCHAGA